MSLAHFFSLHLLFNLTDTAPAHSRATPQTQPRLNPLPLPFYPPSLCSLTRSHLPQLDRAGNSITNNHYTNELHHPKLVTSTPSPAPIHRLHQQLRRTELGPVSQTSAVSFFTSPGSYRIRLRMPPNSESGPI